MGYILRRKQVGTIVRELREGKFRAACFGREISLFKLLSHWNLLNGLSKFSYCNLPFGIFVLKFPFRNFPIENNIEIHLLEYLMTINHLILLEISLLEFFYWNFPIEFFYCNFPFRVLFLENFLLEFSFKNSPFWKSSLGIFLWNSFTINNRRLLVRLWNRHEIYL